MKICGDIFVNGKFFLLVIIDGIIGLLDELNVMDVSDIENILVLKDVLVVIYGVCLVLGVVLVIIKCGKKGKV